MCKLCFCTSCSNSGQKLGKASEKVKIEVTYTLRELGSDEIEIEGIFKDFLAEHANIEIISTPMSGSSSTMMTRIAAGNIPDIIRLGGLTDLPTFVLRNLLLPLDNYIEKSKVDMSDIFDIINLYRFDGKDFGKGNLYGAQKDWCVDTQMWINKKMFRDVGLPEPSSEEPITWTELANAAKKITVIKDGKAEKVGISDKNHDFADLLQKQLMQKNLSLWTNDFKATRLNDPEVRKIIEFFKDLQLSGALASDLYPIDSQSAWFLDGKLAIMMDGYWAKTALKKENAKIDFKDIALVPSPVFKKGEKFAMSEGGIGAGISSSTKHPKEAYAVWEYIHFGPLADMRAAKGWNIPLKKSNVVLMPEVTELDKAAKNAALSEINNLNYNYRANPYINVADINSVFENYYKPVLYKEWPLDNILKKMDKELTLHIQEGMKALGGDK